MSGGVITHHACANPVRFAIKAAAAPQEFGIHGFWNR
jgi:hypothetical protein